MTEPNPSTPKWFATSLAVWTAILSLLPTILASFDLTLADKNVQRAIQLVSAGFTVGAIIVAAVGEKRTLLPPPK